MTAPVADSTAGGMTSFVALGRVLSVTGGVDAQAVSVRNGRIEAVGGQELVETARRDGVLVHDFGDRAIVPGFVDAHVHLELYAVGRTRAVDCRVPGCRTIPDVLDRLSDRAAQASRGEWVLGYGNLFFDQKLAEHRLPTRAELDSVSRDHPIQLSCGGHVSALNTLALELAEVDRFINGAAGLWGSPVVQLDDYGEPTGVVAEVDQLLPIPPMDPEELRAGLIGTYQELFTSYGVTSVGEMLGSLAGVQVFDQVIGSGELPGRVALYPIVPSAGGLDEIAEWVTGFRSTAGADRLFAAGIKMFADGGYSSRNAATRQPYVREHAPYDGYRGRLNMSQADVIHALQRTRRDGIQLAVHANGPRAQDEVIDAVLSAGGPHEHRAVRIEHAGNLVNAREDLARFRAANITPVLQPGFLYNFMADFVPLLLGDAGTVGRLPLRSMLDDGVGPVASSDVGPGAEEEQSSPLFSIWECMARRSYWGLHIEPEQTIGFAEALRLHTIESARAIGLDAEVGSIEVGKQADLVVLDRDPRTGSLDTVRETQVDCVYVAGNKVHSRDEHASCR